MRLIEYAAHDPQLFKIKDLECGLNPHNKIDMLQMRDGDIAWTIRGTDAITEEKVAAVEFEWPPYQGGNKYPAIRRILARAMEEIRQEMLKNPELYR